MQHRKILLTNRHLQDLNPIVAGMQQCAPGHRFGPYIRGYTLIHYVISGKGTFYARGQEFQLSAGQAFLILPGEVTTYEADKNDPWHYCWLGFDGAMTHRFTELPPVISVDKGLFLEAIPPLDYKGRPEYWVAGGLHRLYGLLFPEAQTGNLHVQRTENLIRTGYMEQITVEGIARALNLDRRYLSRIFKEHTGNTIQQYLIHVRMEEARRYLSQGRTVQEAAALCGYPDPANFSKMYKKYFGTSPKKTNPEGR